MGDRRRLSRKLRSAEARWREFVRAARRGEQPDFDEHWRLFRSLSTSLTAADGPLPAWWPGEAERRQSNLAELMRAVGLDDYRQLHRWSVENREEFWRWVVARLSIRFDAEPERIVDLSRGVEQSRWLAGARLNIVDSCFQAPAGAAAVVHADESGERLQQVSYGELERLVNRVANGLRQHGFEHDEAVALYMPMTVECVAAYLALVRAGLRVVSVADSFSAPELARRMQIADARAVVCLAGYRRAGRVVDLLGKVHQALDSLDGEARCILIAGEGETPSTPRGDELPWSELLSDADVFTSASGPPERVTNVLFSSGTTGTPKAIPWTQLTPLKCAMDGFFHHDIHPGEAVAWPTNIGWMMGPWLIYATLLNRGTMALYGGAPHTAGFTRFVADSRVAMLGLVPALVRAWRAGELVADGSWDAVRLFSSTGEASSAEDYLWLMSRTGYRAPVIEYLGGTEIGGGHITGSLLQPASPATFTTPALGIDFVILDESGRPVDEGEMGELFLMPPSLGLSQELLNEDHHQVYYQGCPVGPRGEPLRRHGDQMARLPRGYFKAQGRADDTMNLGGIKVSSVELEEVINEHPAVLESAAVAVQPGGEGSERLVVYVVLQQDADLVELRDALRRRIAAELNPLFKIHDLLAIAELPRTASNKVMRRKLRAAYLEAGA